MCTCLATKGILFRSALQNAAGFSCVVRFTNSQKFEKNKEQKESPSVCQSQSTETAQPTLQTGSSKVSNRFRLLEKPLVLYPQRSNTVLWLEYLKYRCLYDWSFSIREFLAGSEQAIRHVLKKIGEQRLNELHGILTADLSRKLENKLPDITTEERKRLLSFGPESSFQPFVAQFEIQQDERGDERLNILVVADSLPHDALIRSIKEHITSAGPPTAGTLEKLIKDRMEMAKQATVVNLRFTKRLKPKLEEDFSVDQLNVFAKFEKMVFSVME